MTRTTDTTSDSTTAFTAGHAAEGLASAGGEALAALFGTLARLRGGRPLHPQGETWAATVTMTGHGRSGVPWLDRPGTHGVTLRVSRSVGLPLGMPDVYGIAMRAHLAGGEKADLLFASTGSSPAGRLVFRPRRGVDTGPLTTLLPVRSVRGSLVLRLVATSPAPSGELRPPATMELSYAHGGGSWRVCGEVRTGEPLEPDAEAERHDPVLNMLPGTEQYLVVQRLR